MEEPHKILHKYLDVPLLISWLSARQHAPEGGLAGRTNKLVDGCYSHWAGGCWPIIEAALNGFQTSSGDTKAPVGSLYSREGLIRYILCCCQQEQGGLRDKPEKGADSYHTCYVLAGLSSAQHSCHYSRQHPDHSAASLSAAFNWSTSVTTDGKEMNEREKTIFDEADRVSSIHPIFVLPWEVARECRTYFEEKQGF
ncbi:MAG: CAAX farnesyltransferase (FTase) subunit beta [Sclerophora amabilis]|nr:MAG: CAAX farnesyltransferase (FTase) subunit beta [Sclerophora amabilis]